MLICLFYNFLITLCSYLPPQVIVSAGMITINKQHEIASYYSDTSAWRTSMHRYREHTIMGWA